MAENQSATSGHRRSKVEPRFNSYFDLALMARPGVNDFTFANLHGYLFFNMLPDSELQFSFDVSSTRGSPSFYELDYQWQPRVKIRAGKIWIPFDDADPHHMFGGGVNTNVLSQPGSPALLPNLWTDHGVGGQFKVIDMSEFELLADAYVVNGFTSGGTDPVRTASAYPTFGDKAIAAYDNNRDKALGGRLHGEIAKTFGLGASYYTCRWNDQGETKPLRVNIYGVDGQIDVGPARIRVGAIRFDVKLENSYFKRGGVYAELGSYFDAQKKWKALLRAGESQLDNRVHAVSDSQIVGGKLIYRPSPVAWSFEHSRDMLDRQGKAGKTFTAIRAIFEM